MGTTFKRRIRGRRKGQVYPVRPISFVRKGPCISRQMFANRLMAHLGDSHEAREMTEVVMADLFEDYCKSRVTMTQWLRNFDRPDGIALYMPHPEPVIIRKQGNIIHVFKPGTKKFTAENASAHHSLTTDRTWGDTEYFKALREYLSQRKS